MLSIIMSFCVFVHVEVKSRTKSCAFIKMSFKFLLFLSIIIVICSTLVNGSMNCTLYNLKIKNSNFLLEKIHYCPALQGSDEEYCCYDENRKPYCCTETEFYYNSFFCQSKHSGYIAFSISIIALVLMTVGGVIGCLCRTLTKPLKNYDRRPPLLRIRR